MSDNALKTFIDATRSAWGPLTSELAATVRDQLARLMQASPSEPWLAQLLRDQPASQELYRDPEHGFVLLAHTEHAALYRPPHDHGRSWVIYAVQSGASEMGTYARTIDTDGQVRLVKRNATLVRAGDVQVYLPGDIHDTLCMADSTLQFRFTERDLKVEDRVERQVTRYVERNGVWTTDPQ
jgi:hypothetical protein